VPQIFVGQLDMECPPIGSAGTAPISHSVAGLDVTWLPMSHGDCTASGFIFKTLDGRQVAYVSDVGRLTAEDDEPVLAALRGVDVLFLDCMAATLGVGVRIHGHFLLPQAVAAIRLIQPREVFLTGIGHTNDHDELANLLRKELQEEKSIVRADCAFDGMQMTF
jgi:phosphoribosyl 1,2-cyclic phosphodiesterase